MRRRFALFALVVVASLSAAPGARASDPTVKLTQDNTFVPSSITVSAGDSVTFQWEGGFHNVVFDDGQSSGAPVSQDGKTWSRTFDAAGTYDFYCEVHQSIGMSGTITVSGADGSGGGGGGGGGAGGDQGSAPGSYPYTGPESALLPAVGGLMLTCGAVGLLVGRRRSRRRG